MLKMYNGGLEVDADISQVPAMEAGGWKVVGKKYETSSKEPEQKKENPPALKVHKGRTIKGISSPATFKVSGDWPKGTKVKVKITGADKKAVLTDTWEQKDSETLTAADAASSLMDFLSSGDFVAWSLEDILHIGSDSEEDVFELEFSRPA